MNIDLGCDYVRQRFLPALYNGGCRLVAGRLYAEDQIVHDHYFTVRPDVHKFRPSLRFSAVTFILYFNGLAPSLCAFTSI
jgi:hypothetical protein